MKVLISGASGLVGHALVLRLRRANHHVVRLVRTQEVPDDAVYWDPTNGRLEPHSIDGFDAIIHLAGENIASGRWTKARMERIRNSRVESTRLLAARLLETERPPRIFIGASAIGAYGNRDDEVLTEASAYGSGFLADVCREWEAASKPLDVAGARVVNLRIGIVLSPDGGALAKMLLPFKLCVGGPLGTGEQYMSWITLDDLCAAIEFCLGRPDLRGPLNAVAPNPVTNREFAKTLGRALSRPAVLPMPEFLLSLLFGTEMAEELFLASVRVQPTKLEQAGFAFEHSDLQPALEHML